MVGSIPIEHLNFDQKVFFHLFLKTLLCVFNTGFKTNLR